MEERIEIYSEEIPAEIKKWNWGAFFLSWIWGIGNHVWISLLSLIPFVNIIMIFVLGAKGSEWAWKAKNWESLDHFKRVQRLWAIWGTVLFLIGVVGSILFVVFFFFIIAAASTSISDMPVDY